MDPGAKYYAVGNGDQGEDIRRIQSRLYELGYLATEDLVTGNFGVCLRLCLLRRRFMLRAFPGQNTGSSQNPVFLGRALIVTVQTPDFQPSDCYTSFGLRIS